MKLNNKQNKKAFTIVELVIVIAVIAILAAVLIPTFSNIIKKAQTSSDTQLIRNLNNALAIDLGEKEEDKHATCYDAMQAVDEAGYNVARIVAKSGYNIAWDLETGHFVLLDEQNDHVLYPVNETTNEEYNITDEAKKANYFVVRYNVNSDDYVAPEHYSLYAGNTFNAKNITLKGVGFDAGEQTCIESINYININSSVEKTVVIRSNGGILLVNGPLDTVSHYGFATIVNVTDVKVGTYNESGTVGRFIYSDDEGAVKFKPTAKVYCYMNISTDASADASDNTKEEGSIVYTNVSSSEAADAKESDENRSKSDANGDHDVTLDDNGKVIVSECANHNSDYDIVTIKDNEYVLCKCCGGFTLYVNGDKTAVENTSPEKEAEIPTTGSNSINNYVSDNHTHNYVWDNVKGNGVHNLICYGCGDEQEEDCDRNGNEYACSVCGYKDTFKVTLNKQSGTGGSDKVYVKKDETMPSITLPTRAGYTFDGYYLSANGKGTKYYNADGTSAKSYDLTSDVTIYANWTVNTYNITYYDMDSKEFSGEYSYYSNTLPTTYTYNKATTLVDPVSKLCNKASLTINQHQKIRAYYDFAGWYLESDCSGTAITSLDKETYTEDIKLYAKWTPKEYPIVYHDKSSQEHVNNSLSVALTGLPTTHTYGTETTLPDPVEREGWVFLGWYTDLNCKTNKITSIEELSDYVDYVEYHSSDSEPRRIHIYAKWAYLHTVTLKNGDTTIGIVYQPEDEPMVKLTSAQIPTSTKTGYAFDGYYYTATGGGKKYYNSDGTSANDFLYYSHAPGQNTNHTFYARWKGIEYTITYNLNGGEHGANYPTTHTYDTVTTLVSPTKDGFTFMGWYTDSDFSGTALTSLSATGYTKNITLYAKWVKASAWKPLNMGGKLYYPVLGGSNPQPTKFAYSTDGENFTEITKPDGGYTMSGDVAKYAALGQLYYQGGTVTVARISESNAKDNDEAICVIRDWSGYDEDVEPTINGITIGQICDSYGENKDYCLTCIVCDEDYWLYYSCYSWSGFENSSGDLKYVIYRTFN